MPRFLFLLGSKVNEFIHRVDIALKHRSFLALLHLSDNIITTIYSYQQFNCHKFNLIAMSSNPAIKGPLDENPHPKTYFQLILKVGSNGIYQRNLFIIFALNWFITGLIIMQPVFLFMNQPFDCQKNGLLTNNCNDLVCSLNGKKQWMKFIDKQSKIDSLSTQYGPYVCEDAFLLSFFKMSAYVGIFIGYLVFPYFTDNYGRKMSMVLAWTVTLIGITILCACRNIEMAVVGLFLAGAGCQSSLRITMAMLGEVVDFYVRQKYSVALQIALGFGAVLVGVLYYGIPNWRILNVFFILIPCLIEELFLVFYIEETPKFLIRKGVGKTLKSLNRIGKINKGIKNILTEEDIQSVIIEEVEEQRFNKVITFIDIFRFRSLRFKSICSCILFMIISYLYFGPIFIVESLGFNPYVSQVVMGMSELIAYPLSFLFIEKIPRQKSGVICYTISGLLTGILIFVNKPIKCNGCPEEIIELIFIFGSRFVTCFYASVFFLFVTQLYPQRARGMGFGIVSAAGAIASSSGNLIISSLEKSEINVNIFFTLCAVLAVATIFFLPQTLNMPLQDEIEEIQEEKDNVRQSYIEIQKSIKME